MAATVMIVDDEAPMRRFVEAAGACSVLVQESAPTREVLNG